jgi:hypothetical protein
MLDQARFHGADHSGSSLKVGASGTLSVSGSSLESGAGIAGGSDSGACVGSSAFVS